MWRCKGFVWMLLILCGALAAPALAEPESVDIRELKLTIKETKLQLVERIIALERDRNILMGLLGVSALALPLVYLAWVRKAGALAKRRLEEIIESRPGSLMRLLAEYDAEQELRRDKRVIILSRKLELERVLRQHGFKNLVTSDDQANQVDLKEADAVVLDLQDGVDERRAAEIIERNGLDEVLAFCYEHASLPRGKATFANSHMTLFSRLQELLKYRDAAAPS